MLVVYEEYFNIKTVVSYFVLCVQDLHSVHVRTWACDSCPPVSLVLRCTLYVLLS